MRKKLLGLLCACLLLSGCQQSPVAPLQTDPSPTEITETEIQTVPSTLPLLEQGTLLEESLNLRRIPNAALESMIAPELRLLGNGLLLSEYVENEVVLNHISLEDGSLMSSARFPARSGVKLYIGNGEIALCDRELGQISILDEQLCPLRAYDVPGEGDDWYLNPELNTLYIFFSDRGLLARNLENGEDTWLVDNGFCVTTIGGTNGYVLFEYTDRTDQKTYLRCLNLSMATMETLPVDGSVSAVTRQGETWLIQYNEPDGYYALVDRDAAHSFAWTDSEVRLLSTKRHLLATDLSGRNLILFDSDGSFVSQCSLPMSSHAMTGSDFVWSGYWEGYFFTDFMDGTCRLMFWDVNANSEGDNLQLLPLEETQQPQNVVEASLYERAAQLSQRFGVDIRIAEQCSTDYTHYNTYPVTDPVFIRTALDILENALSQYPEGFFLQLCYGSIESIRIELAGNLILKENVDNHTDYTAAFTQNRGSHYLIAFDSYILMAQTVYHEFSHIIDRRLEWDSMIREDALYSEDAWLALQPEGFQYAMSYIDIPEDILAYLETDYFMVDYNLTYPTEDRAVLMESAMHQTDWLFEAGTGRRAKMQFYADCIRDCFDTTGWPDTTIWEKVLK